ncbi:hypothetical protein DL93DRAFT_2161264 [Clavulina sp. PMI_390]|nr:hypothetical protein DL93DRAFT_2161264 [Clavulina sp. PMI_390]
MAEEDSISEEINRFRISRCEARDTVDIRHRILWPNHPIEHVLLPDDEHGFHFALYLDRSGSQGMDASSTVIGVISFFLEEIPQNYDPGANAPDPTDGMTSPSVAVNSTALDGSSVVRSIRFRKFALLPEYQGQGLGTRLLKESMALAVVAASALPASSSLVSEYSTTNTPSPAPDPESRVIIKYAWCDARESAMPFYAKRGMRELLLRGGKSDRFFKGDIPYMKMVMDVGI